MGRRKFLKGEGKREAQTLAWKIEAGLIREEWANPEDDPGAILFEEYSARWLAGCRHLLFLFLPIYYPNSP